MEGFVNKVAESGIITIDLAKFIEEKSFEAFDIKPFLFMELILKEKDFRLALKEKDFSNYTNKHVAIYCSADAIIPRWAYMLIATYIAPIASNIYFGTLAQAKSIALTSAINALDVAPYHDQRIVVKGCGDDTIDESAYLAITTKLLPVAKSIMYGEPCSTVPIFKRK